MRMINPDTAGRIKACRGVYSVGDTAKHFGVSKDTVHRIWTEKAHTDVPVAPETPYVNRSRVPASEVKEEATWLIRAGSTVEEAAQRIGVSPSRIKREVAPSLMVF